MNKHIAHVRKDGEQQLLLTHLCEVSDIAGELAKKINLPTSGKLIGLFHDFGKYSTEFQTYIKSATGIINPDKDEYVDAKGLRGKIDHSSAGAQCVWQMLKSYGSWGQGELCGQILALCIASHHSGLINCFDGDGKPTFKNRIDKPNRQTHLEECKEVADNHIKSQINILTSRELLTEFFDIVYKMVRFDKNGALSKVDCFALGLLVRFLFSCLIDADRLSSAEFENPKFKSERLNKQHPQWQTVIDRLEKHLADLVPQNHVDRLRQQVSNNCKTKALNPQGMYTLTVPTGGGKTYASLRYALHHAQAYKLERIIYVIPYTSIIEQNAEAIRKAIQQSTDGYDWVLEHHSTIEPEEQTWRWKLIASNWDSPIILTTMVQLLETMFAGGTSAVRRLHQLANSVIIFDEIQTLPINCTHIFCNALNFLTNHCKTTAVLCTATQPLLNALKSPEKGQLSIPVENELAGDTTELFTSLNRVEILDRTKKGQSKWSMQEITALATGEFSTKGSCLVIVNTKESAQSLYKNCQNQISEPEVIFHLSTNQYPAHRKKILENIRSRLRSNLPVLCISTQLIEAGVDIDFASVIRFLAGLDSIAQAAGRCNRNGNLKDKNGNLVKGTVHIVALEDENIQSLPSIKVGQEKTMRVLSEVHDDLLSPDAIRRYFQYYFFERSDDMIYPINKKQIGRDDDLLNLLSDNTLNSGEFQNRSKKLKLLRQSFMDAGIQFKAIDAPTQAIIVQHDHGCELVTHLCAVAKQFEPSRYYELLKHAQQYSINIFPSMWKKLKENNAIEETQSGEGVYYLKKEFYCDEFGLSYEPVRNQEFLCY